MINLRLAVDRCEQVAEVAHALGRAQKQDSLGIERIVENRQHLLLQRGIKINQHIAAGDQIDMGEGRILKQVLPGKHTGIPDALIDPVAVAGLGEKPPEPFRRHLILDAFRIDPRPGPFEHRFVDIRSE